jgi:capsular exopolysaccharide synthesis family protein
MDPVQYLYAIRRRWLVIVSAFVIALAAALLIPGGSSGASSTSHSPLYGATAILVNFQSASQLQLGDQTFAYMVTLPGVAARVAKTINYSGNPQDLTANVSATSDQTTGLLSVTAESPDPTRAALLANTFANETILFLQDLQAKANAAEANVLRAAMKPLRAQLSRLNTQYIAPNSAQEAYRNSIESRLSSLEGQIQPLIGPPAPTGYVVAQVAVPQPIGPSTVSGHLSFLRSREGRGLVAAIVGLLAGVALALILERFDTRIRSKEAAEHYFHHPVLAEIPMLRFRGGKGIVSSTRPQSPSADAFRLLRTGLLGGAVNGEGNGGRSWPKAILVTSPASAEGKSTVVANLAASFSELGKRVLIVSCDFRRPAVHRLFNVPNVPGLFDALSMGYGPPVLNGLVTQTSFEGIRLVPSGATPARPGELLSSESMRTALAEARAMADVVLLDTAPVLAGSDPAPLIPEADAVLIVARAGRTTVNVAEWSTEVLKRLKAPVVGVVLNGVDERSLSGGHGRPGR